jgi:hypothetical protein
MRMPADVDDNNCRRTPKVGGRMAIGAMRRMWCAAAMVTCAATLGSSAPARAQEIAVFNAQPDGSLAELPAIAMAADGHFALAWWVHDDPGPAEMVVRARLFDPAGQSQGPSFLVGGGTSIKQRPSIAMAPGGVFTVVWSARVQPGHAVRGQRFDASGVPQGAEFAANTDTAHSVSDPVVAADAAGNTVVAWTRGFGFSPTPSNGGRVRARRFDAAGNPLGPDFQVNTYTSGHQLMPAVAFQQDGSFVVAWHGTEQDGSAEGVFAQRYSASGAPVGGEFQVNAYTSGIQAFTCVGPAGNGGFVVGWVSTESADDAGPGVFARVFDAAGSPLGPEFRVSDTARHARNACSLAPDGRGGFALAWAEGRSHTSVRRYDAAGATIGPAISMPPIEFEDTAIVRSTTLAGNAAGRLATAWSYNFGGSSLRVEGRLLGAAWPLALSVDEMPGASDRNGVLDPGEAVVVAPTWYNTAAADLTLGAQIGSFSGPGAPSNPHYLVFDAQADYGTLASGGQASCADTGDCFVLGLSTPVPRPLRHMDATFVEQLGNQQSRSWDLHIGGSFDDVPRLDPFYRFAETLFHHGVSGGCGGLSFCPGASATREQMAVFLLVAKLGRSYLAPRPATGVFVDVPVTSPFASWIEDLWSREIVGGCGADRYCPSDPVTRAQMAVMLLRAVEGPTYAPPVCDTPVFSDVPCSDPFAAWINELVARGITAGCGGGLYCPASPVTRGQMSVFLSRGFGLELYGAGHVR